MTSVNQKNTLSLFLAIFALLTLLMLATRTHHFASLNNLPSASIAIFFLAGMYLRNMKAFWFFYILSVTIDLASSYYRGQFGDCITTSYPALVLSYGAMFIVGYYAKPNWQKNSWQVNTIKVALALFVASSVAFFISNGSYYALSGKFPELSWAEYATRVDKYYVRSISNPVFYVISAFVIDFTVSHFFTDKAINTSVSESANNNGKL
jgi:hypothetical protein